MLQPVFRGLSTFVIVIGFLAGATGAFALMFQSSFVRFGVLLAIGILLVVLGLKMRERTSELDLVGIVSEDIANCFEVPKALGLGLNASTGRTFVAGVAASAVIVAGVALAGFITVRAFGPALVIFGLFGGVLALAKRRALQRNKFVTKNGRRFGAHRTLCAIVVPVVTISWMAWSAPEADPVILALFAAGTLWWIGVAFFKGWELLHIAALVLMYGEHSRRTVEWGLLEWVKRTRLQAEATSVSFEDGEVYLEGTFDRPAELKHDLGQLDFVKRVHLNERPNGGGAHPAAGKA